MTNCPPSPLRIPLKTFLWLLVMLYLPAAERMVLAGEWYVGNTAPGEWIQYQRVFLSEGTYRFTARVGSASSGAALHLEIDGVTLRPAVAVANTGRADAFGYAYLGSAAVTQGNHDLRVVFETPGVSLDWFMLRKDNDPYNAVKASDTIMARPPTDGMLIAPVTAYGHRADVSGVASKLSGQPPNDVNGGLYTDAQMKAWYSIPMYRDYDRRTDRYWDVMVEELMASRAQVPLMHCRGTYDFVNSLQDREYRGINFEGRWLKKFVEAVGRNRQAASALRIGCFWENGGLASDFKKYHGHYPQWGEPALVEFAMKNWLEPWFDQVPLEMLHQPMAGRPVISIWTTPVGMIADGLMGQFLIEIRDRLKAKYGLDPLYILPPGGGVDAAAKAQAWGQSPWVTWDGPLLTSGSFGGTYWGTTSSGSRHRLDNTWLNDWDPNTNTGTPGGDAAGHDAHQSRLDANNNSNLLATLNQAKAIGMKVVMEEGFTNIAEGNSIFRSYHPEWMFPNQHLAAMREYADPNCDSLLFEAEACDSYYKITNSGNAGGSYRKHWYSNSDLDVYRPLHNLQPWIQKSAGPGNLVQIDAGFFDVWALDATGYAWAQRIDGSPDQWQKVTPSQPMMCVSAGKTWCWGINPSGLVYSAHRGYPQPSSAHDGWVLRTGTMAQLDVGETEVWGVNSTGQVFRRPVDTSGGWVSVTGTMDKVWVGDAFAWGLKGTQLYCMLTGSQSTWTAVANPNLLTQLHVGSEEVWGTNAAGNLFRMSASGVGSWDAVDGNFTKITVGENYAWALSGSIPYCRKLEGFVSGEKPVAPFVKRPVTGNGQAILSWVSCGGATGYRVKRAMTRGGPYGTVATPVDPTFTDFGLTNGATYYYVVSAVNASGESADSVEKSAVPEPLPPAPINVIATAVSLSEIDLSWTNPATNGVGFKIERKTGLNGTYSEIKRLSGTSVTTFTDTNLSLATTTYYRVCTFNNSGADSAWSAEVNATTLGGLTLFINFQPASATVIPAYFVDAGLVLADRGNGYTYGWKIDNSAQARDRNMNSDQRLDTMVPFPSGGIWEIALANGDYQVKVSVGDVSGNYLQTLNVEGTNFWNGVLVGGTCANLTKTVTVTDGTLTLDNGTGAANATRINYIEITPLFPPAAPTGLTATAGNGQVTLSWAATSLATSYHIKRASSSGGPYTPIGSTPGIAYTDPGLTNGAIYYYVLSAVNSNGESPDSAAVFAAPKDLSVTTYEAENATLVGPMVASGASDYSGTGFADYINSTGDYVEWTVNVGIATTGTLGFRYQIGNRPLELKVNGAVKVASLAFPTVTGTTWGIVTTTAALNAGANTVRLTAIGSSGANVDCLYLTLPGAQSPQTPTGLSASAGTEQVALSWQAAAGATSYSVKRSISSGGPYTQVATPAGTSYLDPGLTPGNTYYYIVTAANGNSWSANSGETSASPLPPPPSAPTGLSVTSGNAQASLTWNASAGAGGYNVKRAANSGGPYSFVASVAGTSFVDTGLTNGMTYYYVVSALNSAHEGADSSQASAVPTGPPAAPAGLTASGSNSTVTLNWPAALAATSYKLKRSGSSGGPYVQVGTSITTRFTDTGLTNGTTYFYVVTAVNELGEGPASVEASGMAQTAPAVPTNLGGVFGNAKATLSWTPSGTLATSYNVKRSLINGSGFVTVANVTGTTCTDTGLTNGTLYYYAVSAVGSGGESANLSQVCILPGTVPGPWQAANIGSTTGGGVNFSGTTYTIEAAGREVGGGGSNDQFLYLYQSATGDCSIQARVGSVEHTSAWAKVGVMIRETLSDVSINAAVLVTSGTSNGIVFQNRATTAAVTNSTSTTKGVAAPYWVKVTRVGNTFTGFLSPDGTTWTQMGSSKSVPMAANVYIGLFGSSHVTNVWGKDTFTNVGGSITVNPPPVLTIPSNITVNATGRTGAMVTYIATGTDAIDGSLTPVCTPAAGSIFPIGNTAVSCSVTNSSNLTTSGTFNVAVKRTAASFLDEYGLPPDIDLLANTDTPGLTILQAYAYGIDPLLPDRAQLPRVTLQSGCLSLSYTRWTDPTDLSYVVEVSDDLLIWRSGSNNTQTLSTTPIDSARSQVIERDLGPTSARQRFIRLKIVR